MTSQARPDLLFVVGPTACGKSDFAVMLAEELESRAPGRNPEVINCDSIQFFTGVNIGAAKPGPDLLARARHHLIGHVPLGELYNAGDFRRDALNIIETRSREAIEVFLGVGGSGFYVQALEKGMYNVPEIPPETRQELEREADEGKLGELYEELRTRDPESTKKIMAADRYRIIRALEILRSQPGTKTLTEIRSEFESAQNAEPSIFRSMKIGLYRPRDVLRTRVHERTRRMLECGFIDEVVQLRNQGYSNWPPLKSVGYKEVQDLLDGRIKEEELIEAIVTSTMQLAKRQMTWFKRDKTTKWFDVEKGLSEPLAEALEMLSK